MFRGVYERENLESSTERANVRAVLKRLEEARGTDTSAISLYLPAGLGTASARILLR